MRWAVAAALVLTSGCKGRDLLPSERSAIALERLAAQVPSGCETVSLGEGDRRAELQAALDRAAAGSRCVQLQAGVYHVARAAAAPSLRARGVELRGGGAELSMLGGDGGRDWILLQLEGDRPAARDLYLSGAERGETGEQTHLLQVRGPADGTAIERVRFRLPRRGERSGGDCVRLLGAHDAPVLRTVIRDSEGEECDRSFIGIQRGVDGLLVERVRAMVTGDQAIDFEATGAEKFACRPIVRGVVVRDSQLHGADHANAAVTIGGRDCAVADDILFSGVEVTGGGISILDVGSVTLERVTVELDRGADPPILARRRVGSLRLVDVRVRQGAGNQGSAAVKVNSLSGERPAEFVMIGGSITQDGARPALLFEGVVSGVVVGTELRAAAPSPWAVVADASSAVLVDASVEGWAGLVAGGELVTVRSTR